MIGDGNIVTATDFAHPEGRRYESAVKEILELPEVALESKRKIMWDNALRLYPISAGIAAYSSRISSESVLAVNRR